MELREKVAFQLWSGCDGSHYADEYAPRIFSGELKYADGRVMLPAQNVEREDPDVGYSWTEYGSDHYRELADRVLSVPEIREALSLKHSLETALRVNGSFHVTAENLKSSGNSWA